MDLGYRFPTSFQCFQESKNVHLTIILPNNPSRLCLSQAGAPHVG